MRLRRKGRKLDTEAKQSLAAIDRALADEKVRPSNQGEDRLARLARLLREDRPTPTQEFKEQMERQAAFGFRAGDREGTDTRRRLPKISLRVPKTVSGPFKKLYARRGLALGTAASVLVVMAVGAAAIQQFGGTADTGNGGQVSSGPPNAREKGAVRRGIEGKGKLAPSDVKTKMAPSGVETNTPEPPLSVSPPEATIAPNARQRRVERSAELVLGVDKNRVEEVAGNVIRVVDRHRGIILRSEISTGRADPGQATFDLRIPQTQLSNVLKELSSLGDVRLRSQSGEDTTASFVSTRERLQDARALRASLRRQLQQTADPETAEKLRVRLGKATRRIGRLKGRLQRLGQRSDFARVSVTLEARKVHPGSESSTAKALKDSLNFSIDVLNVLIRIMAVLVTFGIIATGLVLGGRWMRKLRRNSALK